MKKVLKVLAAILFISCLSFTTAATTVFTPSVEAKDAPEIVPKNGVIAEITDKDGNVISKITDGSQIIITPLSQSANTSQDIGKSLSNAYQTLKDARSLSEIIANLSSFLNKLHPGFSVNNLVARDLFNLNIFGNLQISESNRLRITLKIGPYGNPLVRATSKPTMKNLMITQTPSVKNLATNVTPRSDVVIVAMCNGDKDWPIVNPENVVNNGDGTVTVTLSQTGTMLIIVEGTGSAVVPAMSSGFDYRTAATITAGCIAALTACVFSFDKKRVSGKK